MALYYAIPGLSLSQGAARRLILAGLETYTLIRASDWACIRTAPGVGRATLKELAEALDTKTGSMSWQKRKAHGANRRCPACRGRR